MTCFAENAGEISVGRKRKARADSVLEDIKSVDPDDYLAASECIKIMELVLGSAGAMDDLKFTIWSNFKSLDGYP